MSPRIGKTTTYKLHPTPTKNGFNERIKSEELKGKIWEAPSGPVLSQVKQDSHLGHALDSPTTRLQLGWHSWVYHYIYFLKLKLQRVWCPMEGEREQCLNWLRRHLKPWSPLAVKGDTERSALCSAWWNVENLKRDGAKWTFLGKEFCNCGTTTNKSLFFIISNLILQARVVAREKPP